MFFAERNSYVKKVLQFESMDYALRSRLWNVFLLSFFCKHNEDSIIEMIMFLWDNFFKLPFDNDMPDSLGEYKDWFADYFADEKHTKWYEIYSFVEAIVFLYKKLSSPFLKDFIEDINRVLKDELAEYRLIDGKIIPITNKCEIETIEEALRISDSFVGTHISNALEKIAEKPTPDCRNSIKESISALEALCVSIAGTGGIDTLGRALNVIKKNGKVKLHDDFISGLKALYGWTSDADGIRHYLKEDPDVGLEDAIFMLVTCSALCNFIIVKAGKAGIDTY